MLRRIILQLMKCCVACMAVSCTSRQPIKASTELDSLVSSFARECTIRGFNPDFSKDALQIGFGRIESNAGSCRPNSYPKVITIDSVTWKHLPHSFKEILVYHELAHCILNRSHNNNVFVFGSCRSWMRETDSVCILNTINPGWRKYYVDEIFDSTTTIPGGYRQNIEFHDSSDADTITSKIGFSKSSPILFDSLFFNSETWEMNINILQPSKMDGALSIVINEYNIMAVSNQSIKPVNEFNRWIQLDQYKHKVSNNIILWDSISAMKEHIEMSFIREKNAVYVYFEDELKLYIPAEKINLTGFITWKEKNPFTLKVYHRKN